MGDKKKTVKLRTLLMELPGLRSKVKRFGKQNFASIKATQLHEGTLW